MREEIMASLGQLIREEWPSQFPPGGLGEGMKIFYEGLGLDSVDGVTLVLSLEERFGVEINRDEVSMSMFESVGTLLDFIIGQKAIPT